MSRESLDASVTEFVHALGQLLRRLRATNEGQDLSWTQNTVLARLDKDGPATTADLARAEGLKPQSMGAIVSALEEFGLIERRRHPTDGRQVLIVLTEAGITLRRSAKDARWRWLASAVANLDENEQKTLFAAGEIIERLAKAESSKEN